MGKGWVTSGIWMSPDTWPHSTECPRIDAFQLWYWRILESPLDCKEIQPVHSKGDQSWMFIGRTDAEAEAPILWPPDAKSQLFGKDLDAGKDWGQEEKGVTEDETVGWHHWLNGHESEQTLGESEWTGKPGTLQFMGSQRVRNILATNQHVIDSIGEYTKNISQFGKKIKRSPR